MLPTVADILEFEAVRRGRPVVRAAAGNLDRPVRWVHVTEVSDIAYLLEGGELILTTGIALPDSPAELRAFVDELAAVGAAALVVELGRRFRTTLPATLADAAEAAGLPLVELQRETPFVAVTQAVHTQILDARTQELLASEAAHEAFNSLTIAGHGPAQVVDLVASMAGRPVVYENPAHQVLAHHGIAADELAAWETRSRAAADETSGLLAVPVGSPGSDEWGRLVMVCDDPPASRERMLLERGATALVINRLAVRDIDSLERQTHRTLLTALALSTSVPADTAARSRALGVPLERRHLTGVIVRPVNDEAAPADRAALLRDLASQAVAALQSFGVTALVGPIDDQRVAVLLSTERPAADATLRRLAERLHAVAERRPDAAVVIAAGATVGTPELAQSTLREAMQVADTALALPARAGYFRPPDLRLHGLVHGLRDAPELRDYVDRELGALLAHDAAHRTALYEFLAAFCRHGGNKTAAAAELFISRAALYDRIAKVENVLGVDLADAETVLALHFAVLARETLQRPDLAVTPTR